LKENSDPPNAANMVSHKALCVYVFN